ncbi:helix-turn-helix transcriptional regulator [Pseudonocardia kunmingensis]|uniref:AraC family transcriptional regulator n=1 Tax=Pseudonocardia kunmingensis TaxID=630975 RepID=A0A543E1K6_9PSEU|nr:helix-turn-helix transcriptional regulator [Pseudonocardia kunmingensis]TQM15339.1 AraC family transcriptional regulator [Pseudonocardia kunmingensis]
MGLVSWREESELGSWTQITWRQSALAGLVESVWLFDGTLGRRRERHYPTGELDLIVQLGAPFRVVEGQPAATCPPSLLAGLAVAPLVIETPAPRSRVLGVRLRPAGAFSLFGVPLRELTGATANLQDLIGGESRRLAERLDEASSDEARVLLLGGWITERLAGRPGTDPRIAHAVSMIESTGGKAPIGDVLRRIDASPTRFTSLFEEQVGVKPKLFARIVRFRRSAAALRSGTGSFGRLALAHGYYDQSHMNADFRQFAGMSPGRFRAATAYPETLSSAD